MIDEEEEDDDDDDEEEESVDDVDISENELALIH